MTHTHINGVKSGTVGHSSTQPKHTVPHMSTGGPILTVGRNSGHMSSAGHSTGGQASDTAGLVSHQSSGGPHNSIAMHAGHQSSGGPQGTPTQSVAHGSSGGPIPSITTIHHQSSGGPKPT